MDIEYQLRLQITRRQLFGRTAKGIGVAALASLLGPDGLLAETDLTNPKTGGLVGLPHFPARAKRVIFLFQSGGPSQLELFDTSRSCGSCTAPSCRTRFARVRA